MPTPPNMRRIDYLAAAVANGLTSQPKLSDALAMVERSTGQPRWEYFADLVYEIAEKLVIKSETIS